MPLLTASEASPLKEIPKLKGHWLLGSLPEFADDPLLLLGKLAQLNEQVIDLSWPLLNSVLVLDTEIAHRILVTEIKNVRKTPREVNVMGSVLGNGLVTNNQFDSHKKHRKLAQPGFHFRRLESYGDIISDYSLRFIESWSSSEVRDMSADMFRLTMFIVSKTLFDNDMDDMQSDAEKVAEAMHTAQEVMNKRFSSLFLIPDAIPTPNNRRILKARQTLESIILKMIERRQRPNGKYEDRGDLLSMLLSAQYDDGTAMPMQQVMDELITLFMAGHETTSNALTWTFYLLAKHPEIQNRLFNEINQVLDGRAPKYTDLQQLKYTEMVFKEAMRIYPPAWILSAREILKDTEINGYLFPKGKAVFVSPYANHHNPRYFPEPEKFDPERFNEENEKTIPKYAYIPFGAGGRVCIGNSFAMMEGKLILANILQRYKVGLTKDLHIKTNAQVTLSNEGGMPLTIEAR